MMGATTLALYKEGAALAAQDVTNIAIGFVVSFVVAIVVIKAFLAIVTRYGFGPFAWYRIVAGIGALIWLGQIG
jgi:undecaprenyl-diphosphatase